MSQKGTDDPVSDHMGVIRPLQGPVHFLFIDRRDVPDAITFVPFRDVAALVIDPALLLDLQIIRPVFFNSSCPAYAPGCVTRGFFLRFLRTINARCPPFGESRDQILMRRVSLSN